jgi:hypothetical protein
VVGRQAHGCFNLTTAADPAGRATVIDPFRAGFGNGVQVPFQLASFLI